MGPVEFVRNRIIAWFSRSPDDDILRWALRVLTFAAVAVLAFDYGTFDQAFKSEAYRPFDQTAPGEITPPDSNPELAASVRDAMHFDLLPNGRLIATGAIVPGTAKTFADEIAKRGSYVKTVVLQSPGGSVGDALAMGRLIREKKYSTEIETGRQCVSSCPLVFAGGIERQAGAKSAIGVHRVFSASPENLSSGMADAQRVSADCQRYLREMGVDLEVWIRAMETPREKMYYFKSADLIALKLVTIPQAGT